MSTANDDERSEGPQIVEVIEAPSGKIYKVYDDNFSVMHDDGAYYLEDGKWVKFVWPDSQRVMSLKCAAHGDEMDYFVPRDTAERYINDATLYAEDDPEMPDIWPEE